MNAANQVVALLLEEEGGMKCFDYSPEDLARYQELRAEQIQLERENRIVNPETGEMTPEWMTNWNQFEQVRNKYNGMPPKQLQPPPS